MNDKNGRFASRSKIDKRDVKQTADMQRQTVVGAGSLCKLPPDGWEYP